MKFWKKKTAPQGQDEFSEGHDFEDAHPEVSVDEEVSESEARDAKKKITTSSEMYLEDAGVIAFGKKRAAINLQWTLMEDGDSIKDKVLEADDLNSQDPTQNTVEMKLYTDPKPTGFIGVGSPDNGQRPGMRALVTSLAPEITGPRWLGAFLIDEEADIWWVAAFRDGQVFGDRVARGRSLAEELFMSDLEAPDWTSVFAPREWEIPHTKPDKLYEIVDLRIGAPMRSISPIRDNLPRIIMLGLVGAIAVGGYSFYEYKRAEELRELEELRRRAEAGLTISPEDYPWFKSSELSGFIDTCMTEIDRAVLLVPGWESGPISCSIKQGSGSISLGWVRKDGVFTWLRAAVPGDMPAPTLGETGNTASWSFSFDAETNPEALDVEPWAGPLVDSRLRERFQLINHPIALRPSARNQSVATSVPVYNSHEMKISSAYDVSIFGDILKDVPALVPESLIYSPATGNWDLAMKVYHPPLLPPQPY